MAGGQDATLKKLRSRDKVGVAGDFLAVLIGMLAGVLGAGTIAAVLGVSTLLGSVFLAKWLGGTFVTKTPTGVVVAAALVGGVLGLVVARLVRSGARHEKIAEDVADRVEAKEKAARTAHGTARTPPGKADAELSTAIEQAMARGLLSELDRQRLLELTASGQMAVQVALERVRALLSESTEERVSEPAGDSAEARAATIQKSVARATQAGIERARSSAETLAEDARRVADEAKGQVESGLASAGRFLKGRIAAAKRSEKRRG